MWIFRVALDRPYTFIVLALLTLILSPVMILRTPNDILSNINLPVVAVAWHYTGMNPEELEGRITSTYERGLTTTVDDIEHLESTRVNGQAIVKIYSQLGDDLAAENAKVTARSQTILRQLPPGTLLPLSINYSASSVPILELGITGQGLSEQQLNDLSQNFLRPQLVATLGRNYGRQSVISLNLAQDRPAQNLLQITSEPSLGRRSNTMIESFFCGALILGQLLYWSFFRYQTEVICAEYWEAYLLRFQPRNRSTISEWMHHRLSASTSPPSCDLPLSISAVAELARDKRLLEIVRRVLGSAAVPLRVTPFEKSPHSNWLVMWHQDAALQLRERHETPGWGPWSVKEE